jgi:hypothetical protein
MAALQLADFGWDQYFHSQLPGDLVGEEFAATVGDWILFDRDCGRVVQRLQRKSLFQRRARGRSLSKLYKTVQSEKKSTRPG